MNAAAPPPMSHADRPGALPRTRRAALWFLAAALPAAAAAQAPPPGAPDDPRPRTYSRIGAPAADFSFPRHGGGVASLGDYRGKVLILYFGGLWCPDCLADGANVNRLAQLARAEPGVDFLNIHTRNSFGRWGRGTPAEIDEAGANAAISAYFDETGYSYPVAFDSSRTFAREHYAIAWYPTYLIVDRAGIIREWRTDLGAAGAQALLAAARQYAR